MQKWAEKQTGGLKLKMFWSWFRELFSPPVWSDNPKNVQLVSFAWIWRLNCSCLSVQKQPMYHRACLDLPQPWTFAELTRNSASSWNTLNSRVPVRVPPPDEFVSSRYEQALCFLYLNRSGHSISPLIPVRAALRYMKPIKTWLKALSAEQHKALLPCRYFSTLEGESWWSSAAGDTLTRLTCLICLQPHIKTPEPSL